MRLQNAAMHMMDLMLRTTVPTRQTSYPMTCPFSVESLSFLRLSLPESILAGCEKDMGHILSTGLLSFRETFLKSLGQGNCIQRSIPICYQCLKKNNLNSTGIQRREHQTPNIQKKSKTIHIYGQPFALPFSLTVFNQHINVTEILSKMTYYIVIPENIQS